MGLKDVFVKNKNWLIEKRGECYIIYKSPVRCPANEPPVPEGWKIYNCGGAYPYFVVYDPNKIEIEWFTAAAISRGELNEFIEQNRDRVIAVLPASVHSCVKLVPRQRVVVLRK